MSQPDPRTNIPANAFALSIDVARDAVDLQGHVSNVEIVRWMSRAAWAHSRALGFDEARYRQLGAWFVVRRHEIDYHASAVAGDRLICHTWPTALGKATAERRYIIRRTGDGVLIAAGRTVWAYVDMTTGRPVRIPQEVGAAFEPGRFI
jgi:acyl-CoA thioester hydrolase